MKVENLIFSLDFSLLLLEELVDTPYVVVCRLLEQTLILHVLEEAEKVSLVNTTVAVHVENVENELLRQQEYFKILFALAHYLLLKLFVKEPVV